MNEKEKKQEIEDYLTARGYTADDIKSEKQRAACLLKEQEEIQMLIDWNFKLNWK